MQWMTAHAQRNVLLMCYYRRLLGDLEVLVPQKSIWKVNNSLFVAGSFQVIPNTNKLSQNGITFTIGVTSVEWHKRWWTNSNIVTWLGSFGPCFKEIWRESNRLVKVEQSILNKDGNVGLWATFSLRIPHGTDSSHWNILWVLSENGEVMMDISCPL